MGFNTTVVVLNDALRYIEKDPRFGAKLVQAILAIHDPGGKRDVAAGASGIGCHVNGATVVETHHADTVVSVDVGGNTAVVVDSRYDPKFPGPTDQESHECHACGRRHAGYEEKYCKICGKAAQERKTLYEAIRCIEIVLRGVGNDKAKEARDLALEALVVAPHGERMSVLPWRDILEGKLDIDEAYARLEERDQKREEAARKREGEG